MLTYRCFKLDWWSPLPQNSIQYLLCYFIKTEDWMLQSQIACHTFLCLSPPRPLWNWLMETLDMPKGLGLFYLAFLTVPLYIQLYQFIIVQVTLPTQYHPVPSSFILVSRKLHLNLLNIVVMLTLKVVLGDHPIRLATILTIFSLNFQNQSSSRQESCCPNCMWTFKANSASADSSTFWSRLNHSAKTDGKKRTHGWSSWKSPWIGRALPSLPRIKIGRASTVLFA